MTGTVRDCVYRSVCLAYLLLPAGLDGMKRDNLRWHLRPALAREAATNGSKGPISAINTTTSPTPDADRARPRAPFCNHATVATPGPHPAPGRVKPGGCRVKIEAKAAVQISV